MTSAKSHLGDDEAYIQSDDALYHAHVDSKLKASKRKFKNPIGQRLRDAEGEEPMVVVGLGEKYLIRYDNGRRAVIDDARRRVYRAGYLNFHSAEGTNG